MTDISGAVREAHATPISAEEVAAQAAKANPTAPKAPEAHGTSHGDAHGADQATPKAKPRENVINNPLTQEKFVQGGDSERTVKWDAELVKRSIDHLISARDQVQRLHEQYPELPLQKIDHMLMDPGLQQRLASRQLSGSDMYLVQNVVLNELLLKQVAYDRLATPTGVNPLGIPPEYMDHYIESMGYSTIDPRTAEAQLKELFGMYTKIEQSFYKNGRRNPISNRLMQRFRGTGGRAEPLFEMRDGRIILAPAPDMIASGVRFFSKAERQMQATRAIEASTRSLQNIPHDTIVDQLNGPRGLVAEYNRLHPTASGTPVTFEEIFMDDPIEGYKMLFEANQRAAMALNGELALAVIKGERKAVDTTALEARATDFEAVPKKEDLTELERKQAEEQAKADDAQAKYDALRREYDDLRSKKTAKKTTYDLWDNWEKTKVALLPGKKATANSIANALASAGDDATRAALSQQLAAAEREITEITNEQNRLFQARATAEGNYEDSVEGARLTAMGTPGSGGTPGTVEFVAVETALTNAKADLKAAKDALEAKRALVEATHASPEDMERGKATRVWVDVAKNRGGVDSALLHQGHDGEFLPAKLSDTTPLLNGEIKGYDAIQRLIFQSVNKKDYSPERAALGRKMLSEEAVAVSILEAFHAEIKTPTLTAPLEEIDRQRKIAEDKSRSDVDRQNARDSIRDISNDLLKAALPYLARLPQPELLEVVDSIINKGLASAELGNPYLTYAK